MSFEVKNKKLQILLFSLFFTLIIFAINKSSNLSSNPFQKISLNFRSLITKDEVNERCEKTRKEFLDNYKSDYHSNLIYKNLTNYQIAIKNIIENRDDYTKDVKKYIPRILIFFIFLIVDIVLILVWFIFCCCCCCSNNRKSSSSVCGKCSFVIYLILSCCVVLLCVLGFYLSPNFLKSINGIACSIYKLVFHFIDGTENDFHPSKWKGIQGLKDLIKEYDITYEDIQSLKEKTDDCTSSENNKYCILYEEIVKKIKENQADNNFKTSLDNVKGEIDQISDTFKSIKDEALDEMENIMEYLDKYCNLGLRALFSIIFLFSFLSLITLIIYFTCNCECISCLYHLFWNFEMIIIIVTLLIGSIIGIVGVIAKDAIAILQYVKSSENLMLNEEVFLLKIDADIKEKIDICFNGDGNLIDEKFEGSFDSQFIDEYYDSFQGNYSEFKNAEEFKEKNDLAEAYKQLDKVMNSFKNLNDNLKKGNLENLLNCKFVGYDFAILVDELNDYLVKKLLIYSYIIIIADLASVIAIFFGIQVIKNYKGQTEPQQIDTSEKRTKSRSKETKNNMDSSSDNLRK
jgi:hypothetical protein